LIPAALWTALIMPPPALEVFAALEVLRTRGATPLHLRAVAATVMDWRLKTTRAWTPIPWTWRAEILRPAAAFETCIWTGAIAAHVTTTLAVGRWRTEGVRTSRIVRPGIIPPLRRSGSTLITITLRLLMRRIRRSTIAITLRLAMRLTHVLRASVVAAIAVVITRRIGRTTIPLTLRFATRTISLMSAFFFHLGATRLLACGLPTRRTAFATLVFWCLAALWLSTLWRRIATRRLLWAAFRHRCGVRPARCFSGGLIRRAGFLRLQ